MISRRKASRERSCILSNRGPRVSFIAIRTEIREITRFRRMFARENMEPAAARGAVVIPYRTRVVKFN